MTSRTRTERRPDPQITLDLLARHMWIADQLQRGEDGVLAADAWDSDDLLTIGTRSSGRWRSTR